MRSGSRSRIGAGSVCRRSRRYVRYSALILTYSADRSQVHTVARCAPPAPRSTSIARSLPVRYSAALRRELVERPAVLEQHQRADLHARAVEHERRARSAGRRDQAAPVRIAAVHRGLDERRVGDRPRRHPGVGIGRGAGDRDRDQLGRAFAAAHDAERQLVRHRAERLEQRRIEVLVDGDAAGAVGQREHAVVGRRLAVDGDGVEGVARRFGQRPLQHHRIDRRIGRQVAEHRRHARLDHARALGHAADAERSGLGRDFDRVFLRKRIGRHDRARRGGAAVSGERRRPPSGCRRGSSSILRLTPMTPVDATST